MQRNSIFSDWIKNNSVGERNSNLFLYHNISTKSLTYYHFIKALVESSILWIEYPMIVFHREIERQDSTYYEFITITPKKLGISKMAKPSIYIYRCIILPHK